MKNKKLYRRLYCFIVCMMLFVANCAAVTVKKHWWGAEYYLESHEITEFRLKAQDLFVKIKAANQGTAIAAGIVGFVAGPVGSAAGVAAAEGYALAQQTAIDLLITDLERWGSKGMAIVVTLPNVIQGWSIKAQ